MRAVLKGAGENWKGLPVYVPCSGNFTVERVLAGCSVGDLHSNDVSIYSCALGWYLTGKNIQYTIKEGQEVLPEADWIEDYLTPGLDTVATLLLAGGMLKVGGGGPYALRMRGAYRKAFPQLHAKTVERIKKAAAKFKLEAFFAGDCRSFLAEADRDGVCVSFPPTYKGGYESMYKKLEKLFAWPRPEYQMFEPEDLVQFGEAVRTFKHWMVLTDVEQPHLADFHVATVKTSLVAKPVYAYCDDAPKVLVNPHQKLGKNPFTPHDGQVEQPPQVVKIDAKTMNAIRSLYLAKHIMVVDAPRNYAVLSGGKLIGAFSLAIPSSIGSLPCDMYLLSDFAVRPNPHRRLSKLILACVVSQEVKDDLEQWRVCRVKTLGTTAFTDNPVSMKYRGIFKTYSRAEGKVNYLGPAGRWTLQEGFDWWQRKHARK